MKTREEILDSLIGEAAASNRDKVWYEHALVAMQEYADQEKRKAFNEALDLAAENAEAILDPEDPYAMCWEVKKESILKLKQ